MNLCDAAMGQVQSHTGQGKLRMKLRELWRFCLWKRDGWFSGCVWKNGSLHDKKSIPDPSELRCVESVLGVTVKTTPILSRKEHVRKYLCHLDKDVW